MIKISSKTLPERSQNVKTDLTLWEPSDNVLQKLCVSWVGSRTRLRGHINTLKEIYELKMLKTETKWCLKVYIISAYFTNMIFISSLHIKLPIHLQTY